MADFAGNSSKANQDETYFDPDWLLTRKKLEQSRIKFQNNAIESLWRGHKAKSLEYEIKADGLKFCTGPYCPRSECLPSKPQKLLPVKIVKVHHQDDKD